MELIIKQLKQLKSIRPRADFAIHSRPVILAHSPSGLPAWSRRLKESLIFSLSLAGTAALILVVIGSFSYLNQSPLPLVITGLDLGTLKAEADSLNIDISISKLDYYQDSPSEISAALKQSASDNPVYFEAAILDKETIGLDLNNPINSTLDRALLEISK